MAHDENFERQNLRSKILEAIPNNPKRSAWETIFGACLQRKSTPVIAKLHRNQIPAWLFEPFEISGRNWNGSGFGAIQRTVGNFDNPQIEMFFLQTLALKCLL
jgi:hypothetical protein